MATFVIPFRVNGKTRLGDQRLARAMLADVQEAAGKALVVDDPGGQGPAIAAALGDLAGPVTIVNSDVPCVTAAELEHLNAAAPALVAAPDGTTNALALPDARDFQPLYGEGSAARFAEALGAQPLDLPGLRDDVDTWDDLERVRDRVGAHTRSYLATLGRL
jgi:2-phospho-L-lactate guanylyltransferase (CobY/MobA/RfbA family)